MRTATSPSSSAAIAASVSRSARSCCRWPGTWRAGGASGRRAHSLAGRTPDLAMGLVGRDRPAAQDALRLLAAAAEGHRRLDPEGARDVRDRMHPRRVHRIGVAALGLRKEPLLEQVVGALALR